MRAPFYQKRDEGQGLVEYALILTLVAVVVIIVLVVLGPTIGNVYSTIMTELETMSGGGGGGGGGGAGPAPTLSAGCQAISHSYSDVTGSPFVGDQPFTAGEQITFSVTSLAGAYTWRPVEYLIIAGELTTGMAPGTSYTYTIPADGTYRFAPGYNQPGVGQWTINCQ